MKILMYRWKAYGTDSLLHCLQKMGHKAESWECDQIYMDIAASPEPAIQKLRCDDYDFAISLNYFPALAEACNRQGIPYVSWTMDAPLLSLYDASVHLETNLIFCFDYMQYHELIERGIRTAHYLPLATDLEAFGKAIASITEADRRNYQSEVSFVGRLYDQSTLFPLLEKLPSYERGYLDALVEAQLRVPEIHFEKNFVSMVFIERLKQILSFAETQNTEITFEKLVKELVDKQVTMIERARMVELLGRQTNFTLYSTSETKDKPWLNNKGSVDYYTQMPKVFYLSKINIHITLRSIMTGIPLRILDILGCGGFVLTNRQLELEEYFEEGVSIAAYSSMEELLDKIAFYQSHEAARIQIAEAGHLIVSKEFSYTAQVNKIMQQMRI